MKFIMACVIWLALSSALGVAIYLMAAKSEPWLFVITVIAILFGVGKGVYLHP